VLLETKKTNPSQERGAKSLHVKKNKEEFNCRQLMVIS